jgi:hypothetical protein
MKTILRSLLVVPFLAGTLWSQTAGTADAQRLLDDVRYLASPECMGRGPGTDGIERAASYIEAAFTNAKLTPAFSGSYRQPFTLTTGVALGKENSVVFDVLVERPGIPLDKTKPTKTGWKLGVDYQPYAFTESKSVTGEVAFVGYGISAPEKKYDDYDGVDVKGKIVIMLRGLPRWASSDDVFKAKAALRAKATLARDKGAIAVAFVNPKGDSSDVLDRFSADRMGKHSGIVAVQVRRTPCARIFPPKGTTMFVAEESIEKTKKPNSFVLANTTASMKTDVSSIDGTTSNIAGIVPGTDPTLAGELVVIGAHYDHLGMGDENSLAGSTTPAIHFGADDNASGTAGMLELARRFAASPGKRSVMFIGFSGEEKGLLGSKYYVEHPAVPLTSTVAMLNMDMIGRLKDNKLNIQGTGTSPLWASVLPKITEGTPLIINQTTDGFGPSDHQSFFLKDIPVLFFFTGLHGDYHRPTDTYEKINYDGEAMVVNAVERAARMIANEPSRPAFTKPEGSRQQSASTGFRVTFGIIPDYSNDPQGLRISGARDGSPASKAGLADGDVITSFGNTTVKNIYDLTSALGSANPGDVVDVTFIRDGKPRTVKVTLTGK